MPTRKYKTLQLLDSWITLIVPKTSKFAASFLQPKLRLPLQRDEKKDDDGATKFLRSEISPNENLPNLTI